MTLGREDPAITDVFPAARVDVGSPRPVRIEVVFPKRTL